MAPSPAAALLALGAYLLPGAAGVADSVLENNFCQNYWAGDAADCAAVKSRIVANHSRTLPTLELGDPRTQPAMFFLHGWPDNGAEWANLFGAFGDEYFCVATTMTNFHPDLPTVTDMSELTLGKEVDKFAAVAAEIGLSNVTLVAHDWGSAVGYIFAYKYPQLITRVVQFDIANNIVDPAAPPQPTPAWMYDYQHVIISAWDKKSDLLLLPFKAGVPNPGGATWQSAWPYVAAWNDGNDTEHWKKECYPGVDPGTWTRGQSPGPIPQPLLFFWGDCSDAACTKDRGDLVYFGPQWIPYLNATPGDKAVRVHTNHWIYVYNKTGSLPGVITAMRDWLA